MPLGSRSMNPNTWILSNLLNINPVSSNLLNINPVLSNLLNINPVSSNLLNINPVSSNLLNINPVFFNLLNINPVSSILLNIKPVSSNLLNIKPVASNLLNINPVSSNLLNIKPVSSNLLNINPVSSYLLNINPVLSNLLNINPVLSNLQGYLNESPEYNPCGKTALSSLNMWLNTRLNFVRFLNKKISCLEYLKMLKLKFVKNPKRIFPFLQLTNSKFKRDFRWPSIKGVASSIHNGTLTTFSKFGWSIMNYVFFVLVLKAGSSKNDYRIFASNTITLK